MDVATAEVDDNGRLVNKDVLINNVNVTNFHMNEV